MRRRLGGQPITSDQQRALAMNMYGAGADGIFFYNHFVPLSWAPFYPHMLRGLAETREPRDLTRGNRHYVFEPVWAGVSGVWRRPDLHRSGQGGPNGAETGDFPGWREISIPGL